MDKLVKDGKNVIALAQGGIEFYPYDADNDRFSKDGENFQRENQLMYMGKTVKAIRNVGAGENNIPIYLSDDTRNQDDHYPFWKGLNADMLSDFSSFINPSTDIVGKKIIGQVNFNDRIYVTVGNMVYDHSDFVWFEAGTLEIGGVISPANPHYVKVYVTPEMEVA